MNFQKVKGTVDFYPEDMSIRNQVFDSLRNTAVKYGFQEVEAPAIETLKMLETKAGTEIKKQLFTLEQKGEEPYALRAELTPSIARMFVEKQKELSKPVKWFGLSRMWRYERPQAGRLREFYQISVEMFGSEKPDADAEIINLAIDCLKNLGLTEKDFVVRINNRKLLENVIEFFVDKKSSAKLISYLDKKDKLEQKDFEIGLKEFKIKDLAGFKKILDADLKEIEKLKLGESAKQGLNELNEIMKLVNQKYLKFNLTTARGLAYYTGTVFEIFDKKGKFRSIAGGGRYDNMVELFGGESCPTTGFAIGYATLSLLLEDRKLLPKPINSLDYYIVIVGDEKTKIKALNLISKLRQKYSVDYDFTGKSISKQIAYADKLNAREIIIVGSKDKEDIVTVKDLKTGEEKKVNISKF